MVIVIVVLAVGDVIVVDGLDDGAITEILRKIEILAAPVRATEALVTVLEGEEVAVVGRMAGPLVFLFPWSCSIL